MVEPLIAIKTRREREAALLFVEAFGRILRVARTSTDLKYAATMTVKEAVNAPVLSHHTAEAISYRSLDRSSYGQVF